jgi:hypothetical protein
MRGLGMTVKSAILLAVAVLTWASLAGAADMAPVYTKAPPAPAVPQASGYIEAYTGWARSDQSDSQTLPGVGVFANSQKLDGWPLGGAGRGTYWFAPSYSVQLDAQGEGSSYRSSAPGATGHFSTHSYLVGGHFNWRNAETGLLGVFGGAGDAGGFAAMNSVRHGVFGGEGQLYWNQVTLYLQGGYDRTANVDFLTDNVHAWFVRGTGRWFIDPNLVVEATGQYAKGAVDFQATQTLPSWGFQTWLWQAKLEWKPASIPFSFFAKYQGSDTRYDSLFAGGSTFNQKVTDSRILAGVRLLLNQGSLKSNDRTGATLDINAPLADPSATPMISNYRFVLSDLRLKRAIVQLGQLDNGLGLYRYQYLGSDAVFVGVMAQEVAGQLPEAVVRGDDGYFRVDYQALGLRMLTLDDWRAMTYGTSLQDSQTF